MKSRFFNFNSLLKTYKSTYSNRRIDNFPHFKPLIRAPLYDYSFIDAKNPNFTISKRWHGGHSHHHHHHHQQRSSKEGEKIFRLGLAADIGLAAGKALTGYVSGSTAIIADAAHSLSDVVLSGVALLSYKAAMIPKDKEHPYGRF